MTVRVGILVFPQVQQLDLTGPYEVFASAEGVRVDLVAKSLAPVPSSTGLAFAPTLDFAGCPPLDVLCVPGGGGVNALLEDPETLDFVRRQAKGARFVTSVCTGALVLAAAGLLAGVRATTHWNAHDFLARLGAVPETGRLVRDGRFITAGGVTAGIDFGLAVVAALVGRDEAETVQLALEYAPAPPFDAGTPQTASPAILDRAKARLAASRAAREAIVGRIAPGEAAQS
ncbi:DJ-1/PfpI family protein [Methylobacterium oryzihabitans]|uniref:DJ-1/PfpI family protein n=1 Tax=Methylobacterium oryzihabitans TaxID=2499852 RepID=A0A437NVN8_9HYPH|nr:DJ-1/PfpI family protein [Methylobacterium oryzihabitans]RVU14086.1 DJ-1/PfpI family protein [Methylobacterium oryzihabitans]